MDFGGSSSFGNIPPVFSGVLYEQWIVKMKAYLRVFGLWEIVELDTQP